MDYIESFAWLIMEIYDRMILEILIRVKDF